MKKRIEAALLAIALLFAPSITADARSYVDDEIPIDVQIACNIYGAQYDICPELLEAIAFYESGFEPTAQNGTCKGLLQINTPCHKQRMQDLGVTDIYDIDSNVKVAADYLAELFDQYEDVGIVLGIYHGERNAVSRGECGKLSSYVTKILEKSAEFERAHGK